MPTWTRFVVSQPPTCRTGRRGKSTVKIRILISRTTKIKEVPQRGCQIWCFRAFSTVRASPASKVKMDLCSAP